MPATLVLPFDFMRSSIGFSPGGLNWFRLKCSRSSISPSARTCSWILMAHLVLRLEDSQPNFLLDSLFCSIVVSGSSSSIDQDLRLFRILTLWRLGCNGVASNSRRQIGLARLVPLLLCFRFSFCGCLFRPAFSDSWRSFAASAGASSLACLFRLKSSAAAEGLPA